MHPFLIFAIILIVIWTLSAIATAVNKQKEMERRARMRYELERASGSQGGGQMPRPAAARRIAEGIAERFPDVLLPPQPLPPPRRAPRAPTPTMPSSASPPPRPGTRQQVRKVAKQQRRSAGAAVATAPVLEVDDDAPSSTPHLSRPAPPVASPTAAGASRGIDAAALARWLQPATLRQQFILTELLQPPLALRDDHRA